MLTINSARARTDDHRSEYSRINACFHETIHGSAGSRLLNDMVYLCQQVPVSSPRYIVAFEERDVRRRHDDHHRIFGAIIGCEPWRAEMLMRDHVASIKSSWCAPSRRLLRSTKSCALISGSSEAAGRSYPPEQALARVSPPQARQATKT